MGPEVIAKMTTAQMMALDQALAELNVPEPDPGRWAGLFGEGARQLRVVIGRHRDLVPSSTWRQTCGESAARRPGWTCWPGVGR